MFTSKDKYQAALFLDILDSLQDRCLSVVSGPMPLVLKFS